MNGKGYSPPVMEIEYEFLEFLVNWEFLKKTNVPSPLIMGYFITRKTLNQQELRELTGLSVAMVYKELNKLESKFELIKKKRDKKTNQVLYTVERVDLTMVDLMVKGSERILAWEKKFLEAKSKLKEKRKEYENLEGYIEIQLWVNYFSKIMKIYKGTLLILDNLKKRLIKEKEEGVFNE